MKLLQINYNKPFGQNKFRKLAGTALLTTVLSLPITVKSLERNPKLDNFVKIENVENLKNVLSYLTYDNVMFVEETDGSISLLVYDGSEIKFISWSKDYPNLYEEVLYDFGSTSVKIAFIGFKGDYLVMTVDGIVNKMKVFNNTEEMVPVKLTTTKFADAKELMAPEIVGDYVYGFVTESSKTYMYRVSLADPEGSEVEKAEFIGQK